ncbi:MAG TPA: chemotaxis-specific protein-glutamate methyltransferase CheB [Chloroflexota bacterium]
MTNGPRRLRVLVVDDSAMHREIITRLLVRDPELEVAGYAANGAEAVTAVHQLRPDVVTLDERMPVMDGFEAARRIMREWPTPIVMVTSAGGARGQELANEAMAAGILAVQDKRALASQDAVATTELIRVIKGMAEVRLVRRRREPLAQREIAVPGVPASAVTYGRSAEVVAIGASTGGPQAVRAIVSRLPASFPVPILVVQHTTAGYANTLVDWLRVETPLPVQVATADQSVQTPGIYVAPTGQHMVVEGRHLALLDAPPCSLHRPSATVLFRSVARAFGARAIGVLLTGMGDDGAAGLSEMKRAGALTIAQDEPSSVVFGMPAEAIRLGAADHVLPPEKIADLLLELVARGATT